MAPQHKKKTFNLCVDDFGTKYFSKDDAHHLIDTIKTNYEFTIDWTRSLYTGINLDCKYTASPASVDLRINVLVDQA